MSTNDTQALIAELRVEIDTQSGLHDHRQEWERVYEILDALASRQDQQGQAPEGWRLVPVEPTEEMHAAAVRTIIRCTGNADFPPRVWRAMLSAAPLPHASKETAE